MNDLIRRIILIHRDDIPQPAAALRAAVHEDGKPRNPLEYRPAPLDPASREIQKGFVRKLSPA